MRKLGSTLLFFGIGSGVLNLIGYEFVLLMWIDSWGETAGWTIRAGMTVLGAVLYVMGGRESAEAEEPAPPS